VCRGIVRREDAVKRQDLALLDIEVHPQLAHGLEEQALELSSTDWSRSNMACRRTGSAAKCVRTNASNAAESPSCGRHSTTRLVEAAAQPMSHRLAVLGNEVGLHTACRIADGRWRAGSCAIGRARRPPAPALLPGRR
jgi:hypothetical protein